MGGGGGTDDLTGLASDASGASAFGDTPNLTNSDFSGLTDADIMGGSTGTGSFNSFTDALNALNSTGGVSAAPQTSQSLSLSPPTASAATGGDPTGAQGGTQSATAPGSSAPTNPSQPNQQQPQDQQHAPPAAVDQLKQLLKQLQSGKPAGPTGQVQANSPAPFALPTMAAGQTGQQSAGPRFAGQAANPANQGGLDAAGGLGGGAGGVLDAIAGSSPAGASIPPGAAQQPTGQAAADVGQPTTAAGTPASQTPTPPPRPGANAGTAAGAPATDANGRQITVNKSAGAAPAPTQTAALPTRVPPGSAAHPLPTKKGGAAPPPAQQPPTDTQSNIPPSRLIQDIRGISTGQPSALADLAKAAGMILPLAGMFMGGGRRGGRGFARFHGGRFTHGVGGYHPPSRGPWLYHHPNMGWQLHHGHPGNGWLPLNPQAAQQMGLTEQQQGQQGGPNANQPPQQTDQDESSGGPVGTPDQVGSSGAIPGVSAKDVDDYTRQTANKYGINPDVASKVLATESSYGQARRPGDKGTSFGPFQLHFAPDGHAMGDEFYRDTHLDPRDPKTWKAQVDYAMMRAASEGWKPWTTTMNKLGMNQWSGITTNRRFAGQPVSNQQPSTMVKAAAMPPPALPPSSQPMVGG
jgi:hypothetical protein